MEFKGSYSDSATEVVVHEFEVKGATTICVDMLASAFEHVLLCVRDPQGQIRALLTFKTRLTSFIIGPTLQSCSNFCLPGKIEDGTWTASIVRPYPVKGDYSIRIEPRKGLAIPESHGRNPLVQDREKIYKAGKEWYCGDFHCHSYFTDGRVSFEEVQETALAQKLDFIAMSEHSTMTTKFPEGELIVLPSTEITWDDFGHFNVHGIKGMLDEDRYLASHEKEEALATILHDCKEQGFLTCLNHPFTFGCPLSHEYDLTDLVLFEVINAPHLLDPEIDNERAVKLFDFLWLNNHRLMAVGGSDAHKRSYFGRYPVALPTTKVLCDGLSVNNILEAARKGNSYVQLYENFELVHRRPGKAYDLVPPGSQASGEVEMLVRCRNVVTYELICNGELKERSTARRFQTIVDVKPGEYWRIQARNDEGEIILFANPIHNCTDAPQETDFQTIYQAFLASEK